MDNLEILDFENDLIQDQTLVNKIDVINQEEEEIETIINEDLVDETDSSELELSDEELEDLKKKKQNKKAESTEVDTEGEEEETPSEENADEDVNPLKVFALELRDRNLVELDDDWDGDEEALFDAYAKTAEKRALDTLKSTYQVDNPKVDGFLKYVKFGGDIDEYIETEREYSWVDVDIENEDNAKILVTNYLKQIKKLDEEEALELVDGYLEKGKLSAQALKVQTELQTYKAKKQEQLIEAQEAYAKEERRLFVEQTNKIKSVIQTGKAGSTVIPKNKKTDVENFMFTPVDIKNEKGEIVGRVTGLKKVLNSYFNDPEKLVELAYRLYEGFSDNSIKTEAESKAKSKLADALKSKAVKSRPIIQRDNLELINF